MIEIDIQIETPDGPMDAFVARPEGPGPFPAVIIFQHIGGLSPTMRAMARRIAAGGFLCVVPALYHRLGWLVLEPLSKNQTVQAILKIATGSLNVEQVARDIAAVLGFLDRDPTVRHGPVGAIGFGGGAGLALAMASRWPARIVALASILGTGFVKNSPDSPHLLLPKVTAEIYCAFAGDDEIIPLAAVEELEELFRKNRTVARVVVHPGARHGYPFPDRSVYDATAAEADWAAIFAMFGRRLHGQG